MASLRFFPLIAIALIAGTACSDSGPTGPEEGGPGTLTVDASTDWAFVAFEDDEASTVSVGERDASEAWDLAFYATSVMLNGGAAGPADVVGYCLCQNAGASDADVIAMTAASELSDFESVTAAQIPTDEDAWESDALSPAIDDWYTYDGVTHVTSAAPEHVWKVRTASGEAYAKLHVTGIANVTREAAGEVTLEYALQPSAGAAFGAVQTATADVSAGPVYFDLETGSEVGEAGEWDLLLEGWNIRVNGGVSGSGSAGASLADESFDAITDASDLSASHYQGDAFGGVFDAAPWYRYDLEDNHQIWPTFDVYLIRRGEAVYKVQITGYYGATGDSRQVTFRYDRLR